MRESLNKQGQLGVVVVGFFATVQVLVGQLRADASSYRVVLMLLVVLACAVRYWWVILTLPWPFQWFRLTLILCAWTSLPFIAWYVPDVRRWVLGLAALSAIGCVTELFGWRTEQWRVGSPEMTRSLKREHVSGATATGVAAVILLIAARFWESPELEWLVFAMVFADWIRLVLMIRRYERMPITGTAS
jgi:hypothetical protein